MASSLEIIEAAKRRTVSRLNPLLSDVPDWVVDWHSDQKEVVKEIVAAYEDGVKVVVLDAPTGVGKTLIGESVRRMLDKRGLYVCTTKSLQDQFLHDFDYARVIKGRANYPTELYPHRFNPGQSWSDMHVSCDDCSGDNDCEWCNNKSSCPYEMAKVAATRAKIAVLNTSYFLAEVNRPTPEERPPNFTNWPFVIFDEADLLEQALMGHVSVQVSDRRMKRYGLDEPKKTVQDDWGRWIDESVPVLRKAMGEAGLAGDLRSQREARGLERLLDGLALVRAGLDGDKSPWVYTGRDGKVEFKPTVVHQFGERYIWRHSPRFLLMSATVISGSELVESLGFEGEWKWIKLPSPFPVENRRVVVRPTADMASKKGAGNNGGRGIDPGEYGKLLAGIKRVVGDHPGDNILVHCVSYDLAGRLHTDLRGIGRPTFTYRRAEERAEVVAALHSQSGIVVLAPSLDRGIDLPGDACRVQIIAKCPYPYLGDRQVSARLYGTGRAGQVWYNVQTVRTIVQMCGRAVRSREDSAVTYVLDSSFRTNLFNKARGLFPKWWMDSVKWERP